MFQVSQVSLRAGGELCLLCNNCSGYARVVLFCLQATYIHLQPHSLEALQARITAAILANPPLLYEPEEAAAKAAEEAVKEAEAAAARPELFDAVVTLDPQVSPASQLALHAYQTKETSPCCNVDTGACNHA